MNYYSQSKRFSCSNCGKTAISKFADITTCMSCRSDKTRCKNCDKYFKSATGKEHCRVCRRLLGLISPIAMKKSIDIITKFNCSDVKEYEKEIKLLATKVKWGLISHLDYFRIADVWMAVTCDEVKWSAKEPNIQISLMIDLLVRMLQDANIKYIKATPPSKRKAVKQVDVSGRTLKTWSTVKEVCEEFDLSRPIITAVLNKKKKITNLDLRWQD